MDNDTTPTEVTEETTRPERLSMAELVKIEIERFGREGSPPRRRRFGKIDGANGVDARGKRGAW